MVKKKKIEIIIDGKIFTDIRENIRCKHRSKDCMANFKRIYSSDGDYIVMWDWIEDDGKKN